MPFTRCTVFAVAAALAVVLSAGVAGARGYNDNTLGVFLRDATNFSGNWPVTITGSQRDNGTGCLTLNGRIGGGQATLKFGGFSYPYGQFIVKNGLLVTNITEPLYGQNGALMFIVPVHRGQIGTGDFEDIRGGSNFDFGTLTFGAKGGC
jgi:hypothetical protein